MQASDPQNRSFYWSTLFVRALYEEGVRNVILSPGSRSTPLTLAFTAHPGFTSRVVLDERSAAFMALGQAKATGMPSVLVCTSGTALANYHPAVEEATTSGIPMIIASADRPPHLRGTGASQTIDQIKFFSSAVFYHEAGEPTDRKQALDRIQTAARQSVYNSVDRGGVAHVNFPFAKPLEPETDFLKKVEEENAQHAKSAHTDYDLSSGKQSLGEKFWSQLIAAERPVIIAGPEEHHRAGTTVSELAKALHAPVLCEPGSKVDPSRYVLTGFGSYLRNADILDELEPDLILRFGSFPVSKALQNYLEYYANVHQISFADRNLWRDGDFAPHRYIRLSGSLEIPDINGNAKSSWLKRWRKLDKDFKSYRDELVQPTTPLTDGYVFHTLDNLIPKKSFLMVSNSFPVRDMALFTDHSGREIYVNRGAAGIDGIMSTTIGLSQNLHKPGILFIGDLAFLHDANALLSHKEVEQPLVIVVLNNGGGTIFRMLPVYKLKEKHQRYFETPQDVRIASLCRGYQVEHSLVSRPEQLVPAFEKGMDHKGIHVIECMTDADDSMIERHKIWHFPDTDS